MIRILVADNHPLVRKMLKETLDREVDMKVTGEAESTEHVMIEVKKNRPDIIITSLSLSGRGSLNMIGDLANARPKLPVLVLTMHPEGLFAARAIKSGASGFLTKDVPPEEIINAVREIISGKIYIPGSLAEKISNESEKNGARIPHKKLSRREFEVMRALASGREVSEIADELDVTVKTIIAHRARILKKMGLKSTPELKFYAVQNHLFGK